MINESHTLPSPVPDCAKIKVWPSCEVAGMIAVWYHCDGLDPSWQIPEQKEMASHEWVFRGVTEHFVNAHIQVCIWSTGEHAEIGPCLKGVAKLSGFWTFNYCVEQECANFVVGGPHNLSDTCVWGHPMAG